MTTLNKSYNNKIVRSVVLIFFPRRLLLCITTFLFFFSFLSLRCKQSSNSTKKPALAIKDMAGAEDYDTAAAVAVFHESRAGVCGLVHYVTPIRERFAVPVSRYVFDTPIRRYAADTVSVKYRKNSEIKIIKLNTDTSAILARYFSDT